MLCEGFSLINVRRGDRMKRTHVFWFFFLCLASSHIVQSRDVFSGERSGGEGKRVDE